MMKNEQPRLVHVRHATVIGTRDPVPAPEPRIARGTRERVEPSPTGALVEHQLGMGWCYSLRLEQLGRNIATAGGLELAYRMGLSHDEFERARFGRGRKRSE